MMRLLYPMLPCVLSVFVASTGLAAKKQKGKRQKTNHNTEQVIDIDLDQNPDFLNLLQGAANDHEVSEEEQKLLQENAILKAKIENKDLEMEYLIRQKELETIVCAGPEYLENPYDESTHSLTMSDRQVKLSGPVNKSSVKKVLDLIDFYNNKSSTDPIFLRIDSPGGSVMDGMKIIEKVKHSEAPVYVVVEKFAASMAAVITASAEHSFVLPGALILFHEVSSVLGGNSSLVFEELKFMRELEQRLMGPLLEKFGYQSLDEWRKDLYKHNSRGDWQEFGDKAVELNWANNIVRRIKDTSIREKSCNLSAFKQLFNLIPELPKTPEGGDDADEDDYDSYLDKFEYIYKVSTAFETSLKYAIDLRSLKY